MIWFFPDNIEIAGKWVFPQYWNLQQPLWVIWYHGKVLIHHIAGLSLGFMSSYCANEGIFAFQFGGNVLFPWYHLTQRSLLQISILRILIKVQKNFCQTKKLVLTSICKLSTYCILQIVAFYKTYNLWNFQFDTFKIKALPIENGKA